MSTPNFASPSNASKYFVVLTNREEEVKTCPECGERHPDWEYTLEELKECNSCEEDLTAVETETETVYPDEYECDNLIENIGYEIKEQGGVKENKVIEYGQYGITSLGYFSESRMYGDIEVEVVVKAVLQNAYYEGATLDYLITVEIDRDTNEYSTGSRYDNSVEDISTEVGERQEYNGLNKGIIAIMRPKIESLIEQTVSDLSDKTEKIFENWTEHKLTCKGVFSNGEAVYEHTN
jgi:predicted RNA-binding Zn-ribbon protein involved in translation (DUF1610 family)